MKRFSKKLTIAFVIVLMWSLIFSCKKDDTTLDNKDTKDSIAEIPKDTVTDPETGNMTFTCKVDGEPFSATYMTTQATSGIITAKGLKVSNGATPVEGTIQMTISFGTNPAGELGLGNHECVGSNFETANAPDNKNKAIFKDVKLNGLSAYAEPGGSIFVEKYYESSYWQGAKGTFNNIKFYVYPPPSFDLDSIMVTDGVFDVKYTY